MLVQGMFWYNIPYEYLGQELKYMYSGDPILGVGDLDPTPIDRRMMASFGPFTFVPGDSQYLEVALAAAQSTNRLSSLAKLRQLLADLAPYDPGPVTIRVPGDYLTIQAAIDAAAPGDTVLVAPGTYTGDGNRDLDFYGKNIVVRSEAGPEVTIIDCQASAGDPHRGFCLHSGESQHAVIEGFTIVNAQASFETGLYQCYGGGIFCEGSSPTIRSNVIEQCGAVYGGIGFGGYDIGRGGAVASVFGDPVIEGNTLRKNTASGSYGGSGGAIYCLSGQPIIQGNVVEHNSAVYDVHGGTGGDGAAVFCDGAARATITGNTVVGNQYGGGWGLMSVITCTETVQATISNNIIAYNENPSIGNLGAVAGDSLAVFMGCNDIYGNEVDDEGVQMDGDYVGLIADQLGVNGNISADPNFCDQDNGDYHLSILSPCVAGNNSCATLMGALGPACGNYVCGDVNQDGEVTSDDVEYLSTIYFGALPQYFPTPVGDMDCDGMISISDLLMLAGYCYGYGPRPCCAPLPKRPDLPGSEGDGRRPME
jgi:hypothetical protein